MVEQAKQSTDTNGTADNQYYTDPHGKVQHRRQLYENDYTEEQLRSMKQKFLMENVINSGYDPTEFAQFMEYKMEGGTNVDNWEFEALMSVVHEFQQYYQPGGGARTVNTEESEGAAQAAEAYQNGGEVDPKDKKEAQKSGDGADSDGFEDITDHGLHIDATLPKLETRSRAPTAAIVPTKLNYRKVTLKVVDSEVRKGGFFSSDYVLYTISTEPNGWRVGRKDADFYTLRRILKAQFPHVLIPPLPIKSNKMTQKFLTKREKYFTRFLQAISRSEELKSSICLSNFLEIEDLKEFQKANKIFEKTKYGKSIHELVTEKGQAGVNMNSNSMVFCTRMTDFTDSYQILYQEIIDTTREIKEKSAELAKTMHTLGELIEKLGNVNYMIRVDRMHELYAWLSKMSTGTGNHLANLGDLFHVYLGSHLKYHMSEHESFRELSTLREQVKQNFIKKERHLIERKEKLFRSQDISRWGFEGNQDELIRRKEELFLDKEKAFRYMLTKESQELEYLREELFFYSNQCLSEVRRVGQDNGLLLTDHFITMSQIQCAYINQHHVMWADFLSHFSEIGLVNGGQPDAASHYEVIKQRPAASDETKVNGSNASEGNQAHQNVAQQQQSFNQDQAATQANSATLEFMEQVHEDSKNDYNDGEENEVGTPLSRRITKLQSLEDFQKSLQAVKVDKNGTQESSYQPVIAKDHTDALKDNTQQQVVQLSSTSAASASAATAQISTANENLPAAQEEQKNKEQADTNGHNDASLESDDNDSGQEEEKKEAVVDNNREAEDQKNDDDDNDSGDGSGEEENEEEDNSQSRVAAESGGDTSLLQQQQVEREASSGGEQSSSAPAAVSDSQEAN